MSSTKDFWFDQIEIQKHRRLATILGITEDELEQIHYDINDDHSNDGQLYGYIVTFDDDNDRSIMEKINGLNSGSYVSLSPWDLEDPEEDVLEWEIYHSEQLKTFNRQIAEVPKLLQVETSESSKVSLLVMLHAHVVSALEYFLSTTFIHCVINSEELTRKLIETDPKFKSRKFTVNEIYAQYDNIKLTVATYLKDEIFHNMSKVRKMYKEVLSYNFGDIPWLFEAVIIRHHCVHRAGYDKEEKAVTLSIKGIKELVESCRDLAKNIDDHVRHCK